MSVKKISELAEATIIDSLDLLEISQDDGIGGYVSKKIKSSLLTTATIGVDIGDGVNVITGTPSTWIQIPYNCTIISATIIADASCSAVVDVQKGTYAAYPTTTSIAASALPTLASAISATDSTLTGWTTTITAGDIIKFILNSSSVAKKITVQLKIVRGQ